jgi:hypothetical protein
VVVPVVGTDECSGEGDFDVPTRPTSHLMVVVPSGASNAIFVVVWERG